MKKRILAVSFVVLGLVSAVTAFVSAQEVSTGQMRLAYTTMKTAKSIISLGQCPNQTAAFTPTYIYCPAGGPCTIGISVTSELSDITPGTDSARFFATIDGSAVGVNPTSNLGVNSTAKAGLIEAGTASFMKRDLAPGYHAVEVKFCVSDTNLDGNAFAFAGDRTLTVQSYN